MTKDVFLLLNLVLAFYNVGTIWAHEVDIFRTWKLLDPKTFQKVQDVHWKKLSYWVFIPVGVGLISSIVLLWFHPVKIRGLEVFLPFAFQITSIILTALFWGQWQAKLSKDKLGGKSPYLHKILTTHWIRTILINANGLILLYMAVQTIH